MTPPRITPTRFLALLPLLALAGCLDQWLTAPARHCAARTHQVPTTVFTPHPDRDTVTARAGLATVTDTVCIQAGNSPTWP